MNFLGDIRFGLRSLVKNPGFTAVAVAMLAFGIGVNATVFTVTNAVLFKGFPLVKETTGCCISAKGQLLRLLSRFSGLSGSGEIVPRAWRSPTASGESSAIDSGFPENIDVTEVSADTFRVTGQRPILGRDFTPADEIPGAAPVAMLNYGFWERRYAKGSVHHRPRRAHKRRAHHHRSESCREGFSFPQKLDLWVPLVQTERVLNRENRDTWFAFGRLADGVTFESAARKWKSSASGWKSPTRLPNQDHASRWSKSSTSSSSARTPH